MEIFIIVHNQESLQWFKDHNKGIDISKFKFILVGQWDGVSESMKEECIVASFLPDNIEKYPLLLTFTAWYAIYKNDLSESQYVGLFEYDVVFNLDIFKLEKRLQTDAIIGFNPRPTNEKLYLDSIPEFCALIDNDSIEYSKRNKMWNATTNVILPQWVLNSFVNWYVKLIPKILEYKSVSHFHERAFNILISVLGIKYKFCPEYVTHKHLCSHKTKLHK
jgi:hypothetical protein